MIADTSALVALLLMEPGYERVLDVLTGEEPAGVGTPSLLEATIVMAGRVRPLPIGPKQSGLWLVPQQDHVPRAESHAQG